VVAGDRDIIVAKYTQPPVATLVQAYRARWTGHDVELTWHLLDSETAYSFEVSRWDTPGGTVRQVPASGVLRTGTEFILRDASVDPGTTYGYRVLVLEAGVPAASFEVVVAIPPPEGRFALSPNPFVQSTRIDFVLEREAAVSLSVHDAHGRRVGTLVSGILPSGSHSRIWSGRDDLGRPVAGGLYFLRLETGDRTLMRRAVLLR
jgi:hypothetical protein